jgi:hypothetical protein
MRILMPGYLNRAIITICLILSGFSNTYGIGLGEADLRSRLGSPLDLSIPLHHLGDLSGQDIRIALSALNDGVSGHPLDSMVSSKFQIDFDSETNSVRLRSDDAVMEPYLAFTLSIRWPRGFLQREYTVLLDLPAIHNPVQHEIVVSVPRTKTPNAIAPKKRKMAEKPLKTVQNDTQASPDNARTVKQPDRSAAVTTDVRDQFIDEQYRVVRGDSLWRLASRLSRVRDGDRGQWMASVYQTNPNAFIGGRPDVLKEAYLLAIPKQCTDTRLAITGGGKRFELIQGDGLRTAMSSQSPRHQEQINQVNTRSTNLSAATSRDTLPADPEPHKAMAADTAPVYRYGGKDFVSDPYAGNYSKLPVEVASSSSTSPPELHFLAAQAQTNKKSLTVSRGESPVASSPKSNADNITLPAQANLAATADSNRNRVEILERQLNRALALVDQQNQQSSLFSPQSNLVSKPTPAAAELGNLGYIFRALGWLSLGMSIVIGYIMYRDRSSLKIFALPRQRPRSDFVSMLERNQKKSN